VESSASSSGASSADPYAAAWERLAEAITTTPGALREDVRRAILEGDDPAELVALLDKVRRHAYKIVDRDLAGLDTDVVLEAVLAAALAEGDERRRAALEAIG
jgi:hypothetical protein